MTQIVTSVLAESDQRNRKQEASRKSNPKRERRTAAFSGVIPRLRFGLVSRRRLLFDRRNRRDFDGGRTTDFDRLQIRSWHGSRADAFTGIVVQHRAFSELCTDPFAEPAFFVSVRPAAVISMRVKATVVPALTRTHSRKLIRHVTRLSTRPDAFVNDHGLGRLRRRCFGRTIGHVCRLSQCEGGEYCQAGESQKSGHRAVFRQRIQKTFQSQSSSTSFSAEVILPALSRTDCPVRISGHEANTGRIRPPADSATSEARSGVVCKDSGEPGNSREVSP